MPPPPESTSCSTVASHESLTQGAQPDWHQTAFLNHLTCDLPRPTRREVSDLYRKSQMLFLTPECAHASHIVKNLDESVGEAEARAALEIAEAELRSGKPFAEVANEHSDCRGGVDLGWFPRGQIVEEFEGIVFSLKLNQISLSSVVPSASTSPNSTHAKPQAYCLCAKSKIGLKS